LLAARVILPFVASTAYQAWSTIRLLILLREVWDVKILAVDDDPFIRDMLTHIIGSWGLATLTTAESAEKAILVISREKQLFDCLLIDMRMLGVSGKELCSWVRTLPDYKDTPIFMVTALSDKSDIDAAFLAGASDYISKPISPPDIISRVNQVYRRFNKSTSGKAVEGQYLTSDSFDFNKPMRLGGVNGEIEIDAMENYIVKTSKASAEHTQIFSFVIKDAAKICAICNQKTFINILQITGMMISRCLSGHQFFISNAGYGAFVVVLDNLSITDNFWNGLEARIHAKLRDIKIPLSSGGSIGVVPYMSQPLALNMWSGRHAGDILYRSIGDAETRCGSLSLG
jgi:CheY-like chemotaxis protein